MFKDEVGGKQIVEFVDLRAKLYSTKLLMALKIRNVMECQSMLHKKSIALDDYRECLFSRREQHRKMNVIRSHCHEIYAEEINKFLSLLTMTNELLWQTGYRPWLTDIQSLKIVIKIELQ